MSAKRSRLWMNLLLAVGALVLTLTAVGLAGEWAVRRRERTRATPPGTMSKLFYQHRRLMHALERGTDYYGWVRINGQGFRAAREVPLTPPDSVFRIMAVGASTTFDANTTEEAKSWPAQLEQLLDSLGAPQDFEVINAGVPGYQVYDNLARLQLELFRYQPDLIILYQGHNNLYNTLAGAGARPDGRFDRRPGEIPAVTPWQRWLEHHSLLYHKLRSRFAVLSFRGGSRAQRAGTTPEQYESALAAGLSTYEQHVELFVMTARYYGIDVLIPQLVFAAVTETGGLKDSTIAAIWRRAVGSAEPEVVWAGYAGMDSVARLVAGRTGAVYVPAADPALWRTGGYAHGGGDPIHFSDAGAARFAEHIAGAVLRLGMGGGSQGH